MQPVHWFVITPHALTSALLSAVSMHHYFFLLAGICTCTLWKPQQVALSMLASTYRAKLPWERPWRLDRVDVTSMAPEPGARRGVIDLLVVGGVAYPDAFPKTRHFVLLPIACIRKTVLARPLQLLTR